MNQKKLPKKVVIDGTIRFEDESKKEYLIGEIVKLAEYNFGISIIPRGNKKGDDTYQKIVDRMYKELAGKETENSTPRKHKYSKGTVRWLLEQRLYKYFLKKSENLENYRDEVKEAKEHFRATVAQQKKANSNSTTDMEMIDRQMEEMKLKIALHYICENCIDIDEALLGSDISLLFSESESPEDQVYLAWDRLTNDVRAYYKIKEKDD